MLAVVIYVQNWRHYVESRQFLINVKCHHKNFSIFLKTKTLFRRQVQFLKLFFKYDFDIKYLKSITNLADCLSKSSDYKNCIFFVVANIFFEEKKRLKKIKAFIPDNIDVQDQILYLQKWFRLWHSLAEWK